MITMNLQLVSCLECPKGMDRSNCPVWQYVDEHPELFVKSINETLITPAQSYLENHAKYEEAFLQMSILHDQCLQQGKKQQEKGC